MIPKNITKEHIEKAIEEIDKEGIRNRRHSSTYDLIYNEKRYPPKLVISIANKFANGHELEHEKFHGGPNKPAFILLKKEGFQIVEKKNSKVIVDFKKYLSQFHKNESTTLDYIKMMPKIEKWFIESDISNAGFNIWKDVHEIDEINNSLKSKHTHNWKRLNKKENNWYSAPWNKWASFNLDRKLNYWIFQGNPKVFDFETALKQKILTGWTVSAHKNKIKKGDKVILWISGSKSGCYALAEVTSEPHKKTSSPDDYLWKGDDKSELKVDIKITHNLVSSPILKEEIISLEKLKHLKGGNQGTNFSATKEEYDTLSEMASLKTDNTSDRKALFDSIRLKMEDVGFQFEKEQELHRQSRKESELKFTHPQLIKKLKKDGYNARAQKFYVKPLTSEPNCEIGLINGKTSPLSNQQIFWQTNSFDSHDDTPAWTNRDEDNALDNLLKSINNFLKNSNNTMDLSLNTILYGPPGTGKTYKLKNEFFERFTDEESTQTKEEFLKELVSEFSWWEVIAASLYDLQKAKVAQIAEHPLLKAKIEISSNKSVRATLWGTLQTHTIKECKFVNYTNRRAPLIFSKSEDSNWEVITKNLEDEAPETIELVSRSKNFKPESIKKKRYVFTTFHQSFSYEDFIEGIKPIIYEDESNPEIGKQVIYDIKPGLFKQIVKDAKADRDNDYAIFIDEINRGNIANIFGELITLIEDDKRIDKANYIPAKLPYSNEDFGVPPNLYIIGTMNTADRSVEALDTALRRRFSFIEMNPEPEKLSTPEFKCEGVNLETLLTAINARIEKLLDKDYCIGHSYFMTIKNRNQPLEEIKTIFQNKILPLLQEYFYGDWGKIMLVIGQEFVEKKVETIKFLSTKSYDDFEEYEEKPIYNFTNPSNWTVDSFISIYE